MVPRTVRAPAEKSKISIEAAMRAAKALKEKNDHGTTPGAARGEARMPDFTAGKQQGKRLTLTDLERLFDAYAAAQKRLFLATLRYLLQCADRS